MSVESEDVVKKDGELYLGIDLGTSRTSVASSNGQRVTISSHVGYPKDVVSKKLLKKDVLFGDEAVRMYFTPDALEQATRPRVAAQGWGVGAGLCGVVPPAFLLRAAGGLSALCREIEGSCQYEVASIRRLVSVQLESVLQAIPYCP